MKVHAGLSDLRGIVHQTRSDVLELVRRFDGVDDAIRLADRLVTIEKRLTDLEGRRGS
jgi:hypothetical protein